MTAYLLYFVNPTAYFYKTTICLCPTVEHTTTDTAIPDLPQTCTYVHGQTPECLLASRAVLHHCRQDGDGKLLVRLQRRSGIKHSHV